MSGDYLPKGKPELQIWTANFVTVATANLTVLNLVTSDITTLTGLQTTFGNSLSGVETAKANLTSAVAGETTATKNLTNDIRTLVRKIQANPAVTPALKGQLSINPRNMPRNHTPPVQPTGLTVEAGGDGANTLSWNRAGNKPTAVFVIEARIGTAGDFTQIGSTGRVRWVHSGQKPGTRITYRVVATRAGMESLPSAEVTINAAPTANPLTFSKAA